MHLKFCIQAISRELSQTLLAQTAPNPIPHCQPEVELAPKSLIRKREGCQWCTSPTGRRKIELAAQNGPTCSPLPSPDKVNTSQESSQHPTSPTPALINVLNSRQQGCFGACLVCELNTRRSSLSQLSRAPSPGSPVGLYILRLLCSSLEIRFSQANSG